MLPNQRNMSKFRVASKKIMLTYSQVSEKMPAETVISQLQEKLCISDYIISTEYHECGDQHFHVLLILDKKLDVRSPAVFDVKLEGETYKCHAEGVKNLSAAVRYICKEEVVESSIRNLYQGRILPLEKLLIERLKDRGYEDTVRFYIDNYPKESLGGRSLASVEKFLNRKKEMSQRNAWALSEIMSTPFKLEDFKKLPKLEKWKKDGCKRTLVLVGIAGSGRTQYVKALASENFWKLLLVNHKEGLKDLTDEHDGYFLDDVSLESIDQHTFMSLIESCDPRKVRILHGTMHKRSGLIQIMAFNPKVFEDIAYLFKRPEFSRRCTIVAVPEDFIKRSNITNNIQINYINNHTHIYNNPEVIKENNESLVEISKMRT